MMSKIIGLEKIKGFVEIIGIIAIVISLFLVWREMEQNRILAEANFDLMIAQNSLLANQTIAENPDVWLRGCTNDSLSSDEMVIFKALVANKNDVAYYRVIKSLRLKESYASHSDWADFVGFLHQNPGAREIWSKREETLNTYRQNLKVEGTNSWYRDIIETLDALDEQKGN